MQFVKLHDDGGYPVFINPEAVECVRRSPAGRCGGSTVYVAGRPVYVEESAEEAARILGDRPAWREVPPTHMPSGGASR